MTSRLELIKHVNKGWTDNPLESASYLPIDDFLRKLDQGFNIGIYTDVGFYDLFKIELILSGITKNVEILLFCDRKVVQDFISGFCEEYLKKEPRIFTPNSDGDRIPTIINFIEQCDLLFTTSNTSPSEDMLDIHKIANALSTPFTFIK